MWIPKWIAFDIDRLTFISSLLVTELNVNGVTRSPNSLYILLIKISRQKDKLYAHDLYQPLISMRALDIMDQ